MEYESCFAASLLFAYFAQEAKSKDLMIACSVISILIPCILSGLRAQGIGTDTLVYGLRDAEMAGNSPSYMYFMLHNSHEPLWKTLTYITMKVLGHVNWCYFFYQLIIDTCIYIGFWKHRKTIPLAFGIFIYFMMQWCDSLNMMRQSIAAAIMFMGFDKIEQEKYMEFLPYVIIATMFHASGLIAFALLMGMYFINASDKINKSLFLKISILYGTIILMFFARYVAFFIVSNISMLKNFSGYVYSQWSLVFKVSKSHTIIPFTELLIVFLFYGGARKFFSKMKPNGLGQLKFYTYNTMFIFIDQITVRLISGRILAYNFFVNIFFIASLPQTVREKNLKICLYIGLIVILLMRYYIAYVVMGGPSTHPYTSIL